MNKWYVLLLVGLLLTPVYAEKSYSSGSGKSVKPSGSSSSKPPSSSSSKPSVSKPHIAPPVHAPTPSVSTKPREFPQDEIFANLQWAELDKLKFVVPYIDYLKQEYFNILLPVFVVFP